MSKRKLQQSKEPADLPVRLQVSGLAKYFAYDCERYLKLMTMEEKAKEGAGFGSTKKKSAGFTVSQALFARGNEFEQQLWRSLKEKHRAHTHDENQRELNFTNQPADKMAQFFGEMTGPCFIYQPNFEFNYHLVEEPTGSGPSFAHSLRQLKGHGVSFSSFTPDFIFVDETEQSLELFIVDAKSSDCEKIAHLVQVGLYSLLVEEFLRERRVNEARQKKGLKRLALGVNGGVWIPGTNQTLTGSFFRIEHGPTVYDLTIIRRKLEQFFADEFPATLARPTVADAHWHLNRNCSNCPHLVHCVGQARKQNQETVNYIPYLARSDQHWLHGKVAGAASTNPGNVPLKDIEELLFNNSLGTIERHNVRRILSAQHIPIEVNAMPISSLTQYKSRKSLTVISSSSSIAAVTTVSSSSTSVSLSGAGRQGSKNATFQSPVSLAQEKGFASLRPGRMSTVFPVAEDYRVVISLHADPATIKSRLFGWAFRVFCAGHVQLSDRWKQCQCHVVYNVSPSDSEFDQCAVLLIKTLHAMLNDLCAVKRQGANVIQNRMRVCLFLFDSQELATLEEVIAQVVLSSSSSPHDRQLATELSMTIAQGGEGLKLNSAANLVGGDYGDNDGNGSQSVPSFNQWQKSEKNEINQLLGEVPQSFQSACRSQFAEHNEKMLSKTNKAFTLTGKRLVVKLNAQREFLGLPDSTSPDQVEQQIKEAKKDARAETLLDLTELCKPRLALVEQAVRQHFVLPTPGFYQFSDIAWRFHKGSDRDRATLAELQQMNRDAVHGVWMKKGPAETRQLLNARLTQLCYIVGRLRSVLFAQSGSFSEKLKPRLLNTGAHFRMVSALPLDNSLLAKLAFIEQHESLSACAELRRRRVDTPLSQLLLDGSAVRLIRCDNRLHTAYDCRSDGSPMMYSQRSPNRGKPKVKEKERRALFVVHRDSAHITLESDARSFKRWISVPNTKEGLLCAARFEDFINRDEDYRWNLASVFRTGGAGDFPPDKQVNDLTAAMKLAQCDTAPVFVELQMNEMKQEFYDDGCDPWPEKVGEDFVLFRRYTNMTLLDKILTELIQLDREMKEMEQLKSNVQAATIGRNEGNMKISSAFTVPAIVTSNFSTAPAAAAASSNGREKVRQKPLFIQLVENPSGWSNENLYWNPLNDAQQQYLNGNPFQLKQSQHAALIKCIRNHLQLVWGPPGAGKTFFFSRLVLSMVQLHRLSDQKTMPFVVIVSSSTNAAIENCFEEIGKLVIASNDSSIKLVKLGGERDVLSSRLLGAGVSLLEPRKLTDQYVAEQEQRIVVVGSTPWRMTKVPIDNAQLLLIDEGSQMPVAQAALLLRHLDVRGRLIVAGDHLQLPPIIKECYPEPEPGQPKLHGSILQCLLRSTAPIEINPFEPLDRVQFPESREIASKLKENFRMNQSLAELCQVTYGADYESQNKSRKLPWKPSSTPPMLLEILNPDHSHCAVRLVPPVGANPDHLLKEQVAELEAHLVRRIVHSFIEGYTGDDNSSSAQHEVLIVTPHHVQRRAIRSALLLDGYDQVLVDTVEKMQGRTAHLVLICYGYLKSSDVENEASFLFCHNRLNVATTRARCKNVFIVGRAVERVPLPSLKDLDSHPGVQFMEQCLKGSAMFEWQC